MRRTISACIALATANYPSIAQAKASNPFYESLVESIDEAAVQAYVDLKKGHYFASDGSSKIVLEIPANIKADMNAKSYRNQIQSGLMDFRPQGIRLKVITKYGGVPICGVWKVRKLVFKAGGVIDTPKSDFDIIENDPACRSGQSETIDALSDFVGLNPALGAILQGNVLSAKNGFRQCANMACATEANGTKTDPIRKIQLYTT